MMQHGRDKMAQKSSAAYGLSAVLATAILGCNSMRFSRMAPERLEQASKETLAPRTLALPSKHSFRVSQFAFIHDFDLNREQPIFRELSELREQVFQELQLPDSAKLIKVYLFEDQERYDAFMRVTYPDLPKRRAFFVAQPGGVGVGEELLVYTFWGKRVREDLRHELTHALLHSVLKDVPLWLDEGIAEYFEVSPEWRGVNPNHLDQLRQMAGAFQPDLPRLEQLSQVEQMTPAEYREAWAWVHFMLHDLPESRAVLTKYLQHLRLSAQAPPLSRQLMTVYPSANEALARHLSKLGLARHLPRIQNSPRIE
jgi:hypothetical protein